MRVEHPTDWTSWAVGDWWKHLVREPVISHRPAGWDDPKHTTKRTAGPGVTTV